MTIIIHLFTLTARFFTARTTEVFRTLQNKATGGNLILAALPVYPLIEGLFTAGRRVPAP
jgi:hypothetical protein